MRVWRDTGRQMSKLLLYSGNTTLGWRILRKVYPHEGQRGVERGIMREVYDSINGNLLGYQVIASADRRGDQDLPSLASTASISQREMQINAGEMGKSRTVGLREADRVALPVPEDRIERVQQKVLVFSRIGPKVGDILRVWPKS